MLLETEGLTKRFGGITAVDGVDFALETGELCSIIGPNGAGKTTFFNLLTGVLEPSDGSIRFAPSGGRDAGAASAGADGTGSAIDITTASPDETALAGIHRSYQITNLFPTLSVLENVRVAAQASRGNDSWKLWRNVTDFEDHYAEATAILERIGLAEEAETVTQNLSHGEKRSLEIGVALAGDPDLLLLDEPTAGVSSEGVDEVVALIEDVAEDHSVMLIEHNMEVVMDISDRIAVLHRGELIADGPPEDVRGDEDVQEAYLGGYGREGSADGRERSADEGGRSDGDAAADGGRRVRAGGESR
ncbi:ABC transporter ATP-binding protein [Halorubrum ezzemoulense]|uniref:ABC transporter ATP-binding protein n=2 Tax=Halorubrum ezzemoulense TaxID=337243 RepID=A0A256K158_HALEZ|nr:MULTISPECIES: ABC transporter ATP-binding protein [Halorubrum]MDB2223497.1 ABC transporter ATP-binding protein [Halorubrum ezzemoulense]MDB2237542.1 ABC transporter ATP-binding protein [Halorubrum ezzemoulense]MDB2240859.1 ABC transporter ATP-binding protein [Halorubrum ezzemoulense]MDB2248964.1 ABC transporter ATP-binding protein [Halorubrum ezzemoulense]MDB2264497.1 ABC transporter ATP-binding protein [Halorubrum ezzemoulense]